MAILNNKPVLCVDKEIALNGMAEGFLCVGYDDMKSIQYFGENIEAYWKKDGDTFDDIVALALSEHDQLKVRADARRGMWQYAHLCGCDVRKVRRSQLFRKAF
ncbi:MAG: DUF5127 domain-containing protein [Clostridia bacterium]|nr:DUF5127 domain-containing protein [Clostridia bacterium]